MNMYDIIRHKRDGGELSREQIEYFIQGYTNGTIPDYQASALLMAIYFVGMTHDETVWLTLAMEHSGEIVDLSKIPGYKVDKHSTGGVGDKTSLVVAPIVAACGVKVAKMSGRGLGHTGGTVDKLESIAGYRTSVERDEFFSIVRNTGLSIIGQSGNLTPADKKLYALRDVTATVDSIPLIVASIMSKKLAAGSDAIVLDVKTGSGAFMHTVDQARELAHEMVEIGRSVGRKVVALITDMDTPLGSAVGNSLEVIEAISVLRGQGADDFRELCLEVAANMLELADKGTLDECRSMAEQAISSGAALDKLADMVHAHGGNREWVYDVSKFPQARCCYKVTSDKDGYVVAMDTASIGMASLALGAGRLRKEDDIDHYAGIVVERKTGDKVAVGDTIAILYAADEKLFGQAEILIKGAIVIGDAPVIRRPVVIERVSE